MRFKRGSQALRETNGLQLSSRVGDTCRIELVAEVVGCDAARCQGEHRLLLRETDMLPTEQLIQPGLEPIMSLRRLVLLLNICSGLIVCPDDFSHSRVSTISLYCTRTTGSCSSPLALH